MPIYISNKPNSTKKYCKLVLSNGTIIDWKSTRQTKQKDAERVAEDWLAKAEAKLRGEPQPLTVTEALAEQREAMVKKGDVDSTLKEFDDQASILISFFDENGDCNANDVKLTDTEAFVLFRRKGKRPVPRLKKGERKREHGVGDRRIAKNLSYLIAAFERGRKLGWYKGIPADLWPSFLPKNFDGRERWITFEEYNALVAVFEQEFVDHFTCYVYGGARLEEIYLLHVDHVEIKDGIFTIYGTKTKGSKRSVPIAPVAAEVYERRIVEAKRRGDGMLFPITAKTRKGRPSWSGQKAAWYRAIDAACEAAKVEDFVTTDLRRTFASWCWQNGVPEDVVIAWLGHSSARMVRTIYKKPSTEQMRREIMKLPGSNVIPIERKKLA